ncbi:Periodic tryptophan protein 2 [Chionoecetes opilio]|uniref:Periodic tryptophan protein 2 n=1 Tax=Chionoecetes opilio TaxID=41210 RepID=A0A8J5CX10_CHIOP|nr:Periodic tryptophan protein 2 [Chionoecetes opilio]
MDEIINRRKMAENGINLALVEERDDERSEKVAIKLPGTRQGDMSRRAFRPEVRVSYLTFSPTGRSWAASTSEGLLVYSLDTDWLFDPLDLDFSNTPSAVKQRLKKRTIQQMLAYLAEAIESTRHIGLYSQWTTALVTSHGHTLKTRSPQIMSILNGLQKSLILHHNNLTKVNLTQLYVEKMLAYLAEAIESTRHIGFVQSVDHSTGDQSWPHPEDSVPSDHEYP